MASTLLTVAMFPVPPLPAQTASSPQAGTAQTLPDLSGIWETPYQLTRRDICGEPNCRSLAGLPSPPPVVTMEGPQMLPWAEEKYKVAREGIQNPAAPGREEADPWFTSCMPFGPTRIMLNPFVAAELRQFPDMVLLFFGGDMDRATRRIHLDGRGHPSNWMPTSMGHSIGWYEGDTLVVDTIGISDTSWLDDEGRPQSDALHLVERIRRVSQKNLEIEITIEDPKAYKNSWKRKVVRELALPGPRIWDDVICQELLRMGTHYGAGAKQ